MNTPTLFVPIDYESILSEMAARFLARLPEDERAAAAAALQLESEWLNILLQTAAYEKMTLLQRINEAAAANLLAIAIKEDLDALGAFYELTRLPGESDTRLRQRLQLHIRSLNAMGTADYYRARALAVGLWVADAAVIAGESGVLTVAVQLVNAAPADALALLTAALTDPATRMASDRMIVRLAEPLPVTVRAVLRRESSVPRARIYDAAAELQAQLAAYGMGSTIRKSWIAARLMIEGISDVQLLAPAGDIVCEPQQYPAFSIDISEATA